MTTKKMTVKEAREIVEKESKIYLPFVQISPNTVRIMPKELQKALHGWHEADDMIFLPMFGFAIHAYHLYKLAPLMGEDAFTMTKGIDEKNRPVVILTYSAQVGTRSRTTLIGSEFESCPSVINAYEQTPTESKIDSWIAKAVSTEYPATANIASDGNRLHREIGTPYTGELYERANNAGLLHAPNENLATIQAADLLQAVKRAKKLRKDSLSISINGTCEVITSNHGSHSKFSISENYQHAGEIIISMDTKYQYSPIFITDGKREAVIMPQKG